MMDNLKRLPSVKQCLLSQEIRLENPARLDSLSNIICCVRLACGRSTPLSEDTKKLQLFMQMSVIKIVKKKAIQLNREIKIVSFWYSFVHTHLFDGKKAE